MTERRKVCDSAIRSPYRRIGRPDLYPPRIPRAHPMRDRVACEKIMFRATPEFIFEVLRKGGQMVFAAGVVALVLGLVLDRWEPLAAGAVLRFFGLAEIVIRLLGIRTFD